MVAIKDFEMPKSCSVCPLCRDSNLCILTDNYHFLQDNNRKRADDCPLMEVEE